MASVLIVEDEAQVLIMADSYLAEHGYETQSASSIAEAMAILEADTPIDITCLPISGLAHDGPQAGLELAKQAVERRRDLKVLYTTGQTVTGRNESAVSAALRFLGEALHGRPVDCPDARTRSRVAAKARAAALWERTVPRSRRRISCPFVAIPKPTNFVRLLKAESLSPAWMLIGANRGRGI